MNRFTSDELKTINKALDFYKYQMNKTTNMDEYRAWESTQKKFNGRLDYRHGVWSMEGGGMSKGKLEALLDSAVSEIEYSIKTKHTKSEEAHEHYLRNAIRLIEEAKELIKEVAE